MSFALCVGLQMGFIFLNIPPALDALLTLYSIAYTKISVLISALLWSHALIQIPGGIIVDRIGLRRAMILCLFLMGIGGFIPAIIPSLSIAIVGRVVSGIGTGLGFIATMKLIALYAPGGHVGTYQAFFGSAFSIGSILAYLVIPYFVDFSWKWTYLTSGISSIPLLIMVLPIIFKAQAHSPLKPLPLKQISRIRIGWVIGLYHALSYGSVITLGNWVPTLLRESWQASTSTQFAWGGALVMLISGLGRLSGGIILYWLKPSLISNGTIVILFFIFTGLFLIPTPAIVLSLALVAALFASINFGAFFDIASRATNQKSLGSFLGFVNLLANLGAVIFTLTFGWFKDTFGMLSIGFGALAIICLIALYLGSSVLKNVTHNKPVHT